jgi:predicted ATP-grasp superfamily ATP-dependent carboligase
MKHSNLPHAVIIGLDCITGLQSARILARHGVPVIGLAKNPAHYCCKTNTVERIIAANLGNEDFIRALEKLGPTLPNKAVLFPCTDMSVLLLSRHRARLTKWFHLAVPAPETVEMLMDKTSFYSYAMAKGLPIPATFFLRNKAEAQAAAERLNFPCILKPPMKTPKWEQNTKAKVFKLASAREFLEQYERCASWADLLMAQEWIEGTDANLYSCNCYFNANSEPLVTFVARKLRQWPPHTGTSCLGEEVRNDDVLNATLQLFKTVKYHGLGYVEMKRDKRTGKHYIIEPNIGRPTGRSAIAEAGGVELLYTKYCDLLGRPLPANRVQQYKNVKWIYLRRDVQSALYYWKRGELSLREWWRTFRGRKAYAVWSLRDQRPFWSDLWRVAFPKKAQSKAAPMHAPQAVILKESSLALGSNLNAKFAPVLEKIPTE